MEKKKYEHQNWCCCSGRGFGFPLLLVLVGLYFLGRDLGWFSSNVSFWPVVLVALGLYMLVTRLSYNK